MYKPATPGPVDDLWSWQDKSACRGMETELFFAADFARGALKRTHEAQAKAVCATCPVIRQCRAWALKFDEPHGIWGGLTPEERDAQRETERFWHSSRRERLEAEVAHRWARPNTTTAQNDREYG